MSIVIKYYQSSITMYIVIEYIKIENYKYIAKFKVILNFYLFFENILVIFENA